MYAHRFEALEGGATQLTDRLDYDPPGGMLGLMLTAWRIEQEMETAIIWRNARIREMTEPRASASEATL
jgi:ligand-binding SRPBCC domain-containing protein